MGHPRFTEDFKTDAIKQITERGHWISDGSQRLGVSTHSLYAWIKRNAGSPSAAVKDDQSAEIRRLKQELVRVTEERGLVTVWFRSLEILTLTQGDGLCRSNTQEILSRKQFGLH